MRDAAARNAGLRTDARRPGVPFSSPLPVLLGDLQILDGRNRGHLMTAFDDLAVRVVELYLTKLGRPVRTDGVAKVVVTHRVCR